MNKSLFRIVRNILLLVLVVFVGYISYLFFNKDLPPIEEIKIAREELTNAKLENAEKYAKIEFDKSTGLYDSAMLYWNNENQKFFLTRNYDQSRKYANESVKYSKKAIEKAGSNRPFSIEQERCREERVEQTEKTAEAGNLAVA